MANTYLTRTFGSATSRTKFTVSVWLKKSTINADDNDEKHFFNGYNSSNYRFMIYMYNTDQLRIRNVDNGSETVNYISNAKYRDVNGWYHVVVRIDTSQGSGDRIKAYINGEQITSWSSSTEPSSGADFSLGASSYSNQLGRYAGGAHYWNGGMSHYHYCDGQSYDASAFGSTDATTGEWKINPSPSVTYGNEGFFLFDDDNSVTDKSGNGNNFTVGGGTLTKTEDNPSNVFATLNPLDGHIAHMVFSHGNNTVDNNTAAKKAYARSTIGVSSGKYYFEAKDIQNANWQSIGISDRPSPSDTFELGYGTYDYTYQNGDGKKLNSGNITSYGNTYTTNDIIGCAVDLDNLKIYFSKNGVWQTSGDPTSGSTGTGAAFTIASPSSTSSGFYFLCVGDSTSANSSIWSTNFGNGFFGTTAVSSAGTNASNNGIFEYDVPTGYTALSTKGLNT